MSVSYQTYLVGGAVRDELLGLDVVDQDWVVTGATPEVLLQAGFQQVGKQFPVFLHPKSKEEYALARTEKKKGSGYTGFICDFSPLISLEEDLKRRDLTINAIAKTDNGKLIDPFHGQVDLEQKILRHVSDAFIEDPLRVIRVARFAARFSDFGFTIAPETLELMSHISQSGELDSLPQERVWRELEKALGYKNPDIFFDTLQECGAIPHILPEFEWQPIQCLLMHSDSLSVLQSPQLKWAFLCHQTAPDKLTDMQIRLTCPNQFKMYASVVSEFMHICHLPLTPVIWIEWLTKFGAVKKPQIYAEFIKILSLLTNTNSADWLALREIVTSTSIKNLIKQGLTGAELGTAIKESRLNSLATAVNPLIKNNS